MEPLVKSLPELPQRVMLVGNSFMYFNNGVDSFAAKICREMDRHIGFTMITISGGSLSWHPLQCYLDSPNMLAFTPAKEGDGLNFHQYPDGKIFDAIILQDNSQGPIHPRLVPLFEEYAAKFCDICHERKILPLLMMTWAYEDHPEMTGKLAMEITGTANRNNAMVIPAGLAFAKCRQTCPEIVLTVEDRHHPTPAGTYLEACVITGCLLKEKPASKTFNGIGAARIKKEDIPLLENIAWDTLKEFFGWK